jgi:hypothetical protein
LSFHASPKKFRPPTQLSNNGSHAEKRFSELNRASATTWRIDCWQKRRAEADSATARVDTDGSTRVELVAVREPDMNKETDSQRCACECVCVRESVCERECV